MGVVDSMDGTEVTDSGDWMARSMGLRDWMMKCVAQVMASWTGLKSCSRRGAEKGCGSVCRCTCRCVGWVDEGAWCHQCMGLRRDLETRMMEMMDMLRKEGLVGLQRCIWGLGWDMVVDMVVDVGVDVAVEARMATTNTMLTMAMVVTVAMSLLLADHLVDIVGSETSSRQHLADNIEIKLESNNMGKQNTQRFTNIYYILNTLLHYHQPKPPL